MFSPLKRSTSHPVERGDFGHDAWLMLPLPFKVPQKPKFGLFFAQELQTLKLLPGHPNFIFPLLIQMVTKAEVCDMSKEMFGASMQFNCSYSFLHKTVKISF